MEKENIKRKKKIAAYLLLLLSLIVTYVMMEVFEVLKSISQLNVADSAIIGFYADILKWLIALIVVVILAVVLYVKVISNKE